MKPNRNSTMRSAFVRDGLMWMLAGVTLGVFFLWKAAPEGKRTGEGERIASSTTASRRTTKIQDLRVGDTVLSRDEADPNAPLGHREVTALSRNTAFRLQVIRFADGTGKIQEIRTTDKHPFWVIGKGWTDASQLSAGMSLTQPDGSRAELLSNVAEEHAEGVPVFNLTVAESHTYFVSAANSTGPPVWVHNVDCPLSGLNSLNPSFVPNPQRVLQNLTDRAIVEIGNNPGIARSLMTDGSYLHLVERDGLAGASYGKAVERLVGRYVQADANLSSILSYQARPFVSTPDFFGYQGFNLSTFDITTIREIGEHSTRFYGPYTRYVTYPSLPKNLVFPR